MSEFNRWLSRRNPRYFLEQERTPVPPAPVEDAFEAAERRRAAIKKRRDAAAAAGQPQPPMGQNPPAPAEDAFEAAERRRAEIKKRRDAAAAAQQPPMGQQQPTTGSVPPASGENSDSHETSDKQLKNLRISDLFYGDTSDRDSMTRLLNRYIKLKGGIDNLNEDDFNFLVAGVYFEKFDDLVLPPVEAQRLLKTRKLTISKKHQLSTIANLPLTLSRADFDTTNINQIHDIKDNNFRNEVLIGYIKYINGINNLKSKDIDTIVYGVSNNHFDESVFNGQDISKLLTRRDLSPKTIEKLKSISATSYQ